MKRLNAKNISKLALEKLIGKKLTSIDYRRFLDILSDENENTRHNLVGTLLEYRNLLEHTKNKSLSELLMGIKYVSYIHSGENVLEAYCKSHSFYKHIQEYMLGTLDKQEKQKLKEALEREATIYSKSQFILKLTNTLDFPLHLLYNGYRYQAIESLRKDMMNSPRAQDRITAADKLLTHLNPNVTQTNVNIRIGEDSKSLIDTYQEALAMLANKKLEMIDSGKNLKEVTNLHIHENVIEGEIE